MNLRDTLRDDVDRPEPKLYSITLPNGEVRSKRGIKRAWQYGIITQHPKGWAYWSVYWATTRQQAERWAKRFWSYRSPEERKRSTKPTVVKARVRKTR